MLYSKKTDYLMESIRLGREMDRREKLNLIVGLSIPSMLAQISTVMMFFIDNPNFRSILDAIYKD